MPLTDHTYSSGIQVGGTHLINMEQISIKKGLFKVEVAPNPLMNSYPYTPTAA